MAMMLHDLKYVFQLQSTCSLRSDSTTYRCESIDNVIYKINVLGVYKLVYNVICGR